MEEKKPRGGKREGAGRKRTSVKSYAFHAPQEVHDILESVEGSKSAYICQCILMATEMMRSAKKKLNKITLPPILLGSVSPKPNDFRHCCGWLNDLSSLCTVAVAETPAWLSLEPGTPTQRDVFIPKCLMKIKKHCWSLSL